MRASERIRNKINNGEIRASQRIRERLDGSSASSADEEETKRGTLGGGVSRVENTDYDPIRETTAGSGKAGRVSEKLSQYREQLDETKNGYEKQTERGSGEDYYRDLAAYVNDPEYRGQATSGKNVLNIVSNALGAGEKKDTLIDYGFPNAGLMNEEESRIFNAYINRGDYEGASKFMWDINEDLDRRAYEIDRQRIQNKVDNTSGVKGFLQNALYTAESTIENAVGNVTAGLYDATHALGQTVGRATSNLLGVDYDENTIDTWNPYDKAHTFSLGASTRREAVGNEIESMSDATLLGTNVGRFLYDTGTSMLDSAVGAMTGNSAYTILMGLGAGSQRMRELYEKGASEEQVAIGGALAGIAEATFEYVSLDKLIKTGAPVNWKAAVKSVLAQTGIEASEEVCTEIANMITDGLVMGEKSDLNDVKNSYLEQGYTEEAASREMKAEAVRRVVLAGLGGALSGGAMGSAASGIQYSRYGNLGENLRTSNVNMQSVQDAYNSLSKKQSTQDVSTMTDAERGGLYSETADKINDNIRKADKLSDEEIKATAQAIDSMRAARETQETRHELVKSWSEEISEGARETVQSAYDYDNPVDVESFVKTGEKVYEYGLQGHDVDSAMQNRGVLTEQQALDIYKKGRADRKTEIDTRQKQIDDALTKYFGNEENKVTKYNTTFSTEAFTYKGQNFKGVDLNSPEITDTQRTVAQMFKSLGEHTGVNIQLYQSEADTNGEYTAPNGFYSAANNTIYVDVNAGINSDSTENLMIPTMSHELTHKFKSISAEMYENLREKVVGIVAKHNGMTSEQYVAYVMEDMANDETYKGHEITDELAMDEITAMGCEDMLSKSEWAREMMSTMTETEQKSFIQTVKDVITSVRDWIREVLNISSKSQNVSDEAKILRQYEAEANEVLEIWDGLLVASKHVTDATSAVEDDTLYSTRKKGNALYEVMGEEERLREENEALKADLDKLKARIQLDKTLTGGKVLNETSLKKAANEIKRLAGSRYSTDTLAGQLKELYGLLFEENVDNATFFAKCDDIARDVIPEQKQGARDDYSQSILNSLRSYDKIKLSATQKAEAISAYGGARELQRAWFGKLNISYTEGTELDTIWQELAEEYPATFDKDTVDADMLPALIEIYENARDAYDISEQYDTEEAVRYIAAEIYNQFWQVDSIKTTADKNKAQVDKLRSEHWQAMRELRESYKQRLEDQRIADSMHSGALMERLRQSKTDAIERTKAQGKARMDAYKERNERISQINKITKNALDLNKKLLSNSQKDHVPEMVKKPLAQFLNALDFTSESDIRGHRDENGNYQYTKKYKSIQNAFAHVAQMVSEINASQTEVEGADNGTTLSGDGIYYDLPEGFEQDVTALNARISDIAAEYGDGMNVLRNMTSDELKELNRVIKTLKASINGINKMFVAANGARVSDLATSTIETISPLGQREGSKTKDWMNKILDWNNLLPIYAFDRFGKGGQQVFESLMDGWDKFAFNIETIKDFTRSIYGDDATKWKDSVNTWESDVHTFDVHGQEVSLTTAHIMSLYCLTKREQARQHILNASDNKGQGIRIADFEVNGKQYNQAKGTLISEAELNEILNTLSEEQLQVADKIQKFMNTTCQDWGNDVTYKRFGYYGMTEENYFPIQSDSNQVGKGDPTDKRSSVFTLANMGFTKSLNTKANNRIVISSIFDVFTQHSSDMAKYNALVLPVLDMYKWYAWAGKTETETGEVEKYSLRQALETAFGKEAQKYIFNFMNDVNGTYNGGRESGKGALLSNYKAAAVAYNLRVAALQGTAYVRAAAAIEPKYLIKALKGKNQSATAVKKSGIAAWKIDLGMYDSNVGASVQDQIKGNDSVKDKLVEAGLKGAEMGDRLTWGNIWTAAELWVKDNQSAEIDRAVKEARQSGMSGREVEEVRQKKLDELTNKKFRDIIYRTQVADSTMTRSQLMRDQGTGSKLVTPFMAEPTVSYNIFLNLANGYMDEARRTNKSTALKKYGKPLAKAAAVYTSTNIVAAMVESLIDTMRKKDKDEEFGEKYLSEFLSNFKTDMSILQKIPFVKYFATGAAYLIRKAILDSDLGDNKFIQTWIGDNYYFDIGQNMELAVFDTVVDGSEAALKAIDEGELDYKTTYKILQGVSQVTGVAASNALRDVRAIWNSTIGAIFDDLYWE